jgi:hypothetical protein
VNKLLSENRALFLLMSLLLFFVLTPFLQDNHAGEGFLVAGTYLTLIAATLELSKRKGLLWIAVPLAAASMVLLAVSHSYHSEVRMLELASDLVLGGFLALVGVALFMYLLRPGAITAGRLYVSVSLYFLMAVGWFVVYKLIDLIQPGSFGAKGGFIRKG